MISEMRRRAGLDSRDGLEAQLRRGATAVAAARVAIGVAALARPDVPSRPWVGAGTGDGDGRTGSAGLASQVFGRALGGRDLALGIGALVALGQPQDSGPASVWVAAGALADALDVVTSLASWRDLPRLTRWLVIGSAAGAALAGAAGAVALRTGTGGDSR